MKNFISTIIIAIFFIIFGIYSYLSQPELYDNNQIFQHQHAVNNNVDITILGTNSYYKGKSGYSYYIFTDKGRLLVDSKESLLNSSLFDKAKNNINNTCSAVVDSKIFSSDWEIHKLDC